jgi:site-specific DNA recombinase
VSKGERLKIAERSRRGMLRKAREGKVILPPIPDFGFGTNEARDGYVVDEEKMVLVRRIFRMVG